MSLTATRLKRVNTVSTTRVLYKLSETTTTVELDETTTSFDHVVLSLGRMGDTCVFPADSDGDILSYLGFGFIAGPVRHLDDREMDAYVAECVAQHIADDGVPTTSYWAETVLDRLTTGGGWNE